MTRKKQTMTAMVSAVLLAIMLSGCGSQTSTETAEETTVAAETVEETEETEEEEEEVGEASDDGMAAAAALVEDIPTVQAFTDDAVPEEDMDKILYAGINAPSAMNGQNWHFTAVTDADVLQQIADGMGGGPGAAAPLDEDAGDEDGEASDDAELSTAPQPSTSGGVAKAGITDAPLAIVISCGEGGEFDAGLACQNMSAEAQLLGYGTKIISSPTMALNGDNQETFRELLGIPDDQSAVAVLLVGIEDTSLAADEVTAATARKDFDEVVTKVAP